MKDSVIVELTLDELLRAAGRYLRLKGVVPMGKYSMVSWNNRKSAGVGDDIPVILQFYDGSKEGIENKSLPSMATGDEKKVVEVECRKLNIG